MTLRSASSWFSFFVLFLLVVKQGGWTFPDRGRILVAVCTSTRIRTRQNARAIFFSFHFFHFFFPFFFSQCFLWRAHAVDFLFPVFLLLLFFLSCCLGESNSSSIISYTCCWVMHCYTQCVFGGSTCERTVLYYCCCCCCCCDSDDFYSGGVDI